MHCLHVFVLFFLTYLGKKNVLKKSQDSAEHKDSSQNETKENKPATNKVCFYMVLFEFCGCFFAN